MSFVWELLSFLSGLLFERQNVEANVRQHHFCGHGQDNCVPTLDMVVKESKREKVKMREREREIVQFPAALWCYELLFSCMSSISIRFLADCLACSQACMHASM